MANKNQYGNKNPNWRGGKHKNPQGYIRINMPDHSKAKDGRIFEHIAVMEQHLKRHLKKGELVHHINEIKEDNKIENLKLITKGEHNKIHHTGNKSKCFIHGKSKTKEYHNAKQRERIEKNRSEVNKKSLLGYYKNHEKNKARKRELYKLHKFSLSPVESGRGRKQNNKNILG